MLHAMEVLRPGAQRSPSLDIATPAVSGPGTLNTIFPDRSSIATVVQEQSPSARNHEECAMSISIRTCLITALLLLAACGEEGTGGSQPMNQVVNTAGSAPPPPVVRTATLLVQNRYTNLTVTGVFLSPSYENLWGTNQLNGSLLPPGEDLTLRQIPCDDYYDLKITGSGGSTIGIETEIYFACGLQRTVVLSR
jgi:hypothetical protein